MKLLFGLLAGLLVYLANLWMSAHRVPYDESVANWIVNPDPGIGNTASGGGTLSPSWIANYRLQASQSSTQEIRNLPDPLKAGLTLTLTFYSTAGANLRVIAQTPVQALYSGTQANRIQYITFTAANHNVQLISVPVATGSYTGSQTTVTNTSGFRWQIVYNDGATLS